jgi:hypothetical protein
MRRDAKGLVVQIEIRDDKGKVVGETDAVSFKGLLSLAHEEGLRSIRTTLLQTPSAENGMTAIVASVVKTNRGTFTGIGDANPDNVSAQVSAHFIRMAETRATARALRLAVNIGEVAIEELSGGVSLVERPLTPPPAHRQPTAQAEGASPGNGGRRTEALRRAIDRQHGRDDRPTEAADGDSRPMSREQRKLLFRLAFEGGADRDAATEVVLRALGTPSFEEATRAMASRAIDAEIRRVRGNGDASGRSEARHGA